MARPSPEPCAHCVRPSENNLPRRETGSAKTEELLDADNHYDRRNFKLSQGLRRHEIEKIKAAAAQSRPKLEIKGISIFRLLARFGRLEQWGGNKSRPQPS